MEMEHFPRYLVLDGFAWIQAERAREKRLLFHDFMIGRPLYGRHKCAMTTATMASLDERVDWILPSVEIPLKILI